MKKATLIFLLLLFIGLASIGQTLITKGQQAQDGDFKLRVKIAMVKAATSVAAETETIYKAYQKRQAYAVVILNDPDTKIHAFAFAVAAAPGITTTPTDSDIEFTVNSLFNAMAGVKASDATTAANP